MPEDPEELALRIKVQRMYEAADRVLAESVSPDKLKNNPFKGKPLDLSVNPFEKDRALGHRMLKSSGHAPMWIEMKKELLAERKDIRRTIDEYVAAIERRRRADERGAVAHSAAGSSSGSTSRSATDTVSRPSNISVGPTSKPGSSDSLTDPIHRRFLERIHERVTRLRKKIERYNLETPLMDQQLMNERPQDWVNDARIRIEEAERGVQ